MVASTTGSGGARFSQLEGCWEGDGRRDRGPGRQPTAIYIVSTDGGVSNEGQVFVYDPQAETITLIYESPGQFECENPDNITVTPRCGVLLCEDNAGPTTNPAEWLIGLTGDGGAFTFAENNVILTAAYNSVVLPGNCRQNDWAGACFSTNGQWLFVNIQTPGITFAITGPWGERSALRTSDLFVE